jgi:hypothetical protein
MKDTLRSIGVSASIIAICSTIAFAVNSRSTSDASIARATACVSAGGSFIRNDDAALCIMPASTRDAAPVIRDFLAHSRKS